MNRRFFDPPPISTRTEAMFQASMAERGLDYQCNGELLTTVLPPLLRRQFAGKSDLDVVELGPHATTIVAHTLQHHMRHYIGIDYSPSCVAKQAELFEFQKVPRATARLGNTYALDLPDASQDVVIATCHDPLYSGAPIQFAQAFGEVFRVLRDDGQFILAPWSEANYKGPPPPFGCATYKPTHQAAAPFLQFRVARMVHRWDGCIPPSFVLVLKKNLAKRGSLDYIDFYEEAEQMGRRLVDDYLAIAREDEEKNKRAILIWKQHALSRTRLHNGPREAASSWNYQIKITA